MLFSTRRRALASLTVALFSSAALPALAAPDANATAEALAALVAAQSEGNTLTYANASATATDVILSGAKITSAEDGSTAEIPELVIVNPVPRAEGGFTADSMTFNNAKLVNAGDEADTVTIAEGTASGIIVPSPAEIEDNPRFAPFSTLDLRGLVGTSEAAGFPVNIESMHVELANVVDGQPNDVKLLMDGIVIPLEAFEFDAGTAGLLADMGYTDSFVVGVTVDGAYAEEADTLTVRSIALRAADVGELNISGVIGDFPIGNLLEGAELAQEALTAATLHNAKVTFTNAGIVDRAMEAQAKAAGATKETFAMTFSMALPFTLGMTLGNGPLTQALTEPLAAFLNDPKSLTVTATPAQPIPVLAIVTQAQQGIQTLPEFLGLDVKANQ
jgi:hypothetical protein